MPTKDPSTQQIIINKICPPVSQLIYILFHNPTHTHTHTQPAAVPYSLKLFQNCLLKPWHLSSAVFTPHPYLLTYLWITFQTYLFLSGSRPICKMELTYVFPISNSISGQNKRTDMKRLCKLENATKVP